MSDNEASGSPEASRSPEHSSRDDSFMDHSDEDDGYSDRLRSPSPPTRNPEPPESPPHELPFHNPEPPPELMRSNLLDADNIGDTMFSKQWTLSTLGLLVQMVQQPDDDIELDEDIQTELGNLWDMCVNSDVVEFIQEMGALTFLFGVIDKTKKPRAIEICVGILGNMASCRYAVCQSIADNSEFVAVMLRLFRDTDQLTLIQTVRLAQICLNSEQCKAQWNNFLTRDPCVYDQLLFIFNSSPNDELLHLVGKLVDTLIDYATDNKDDALLQEWFSPQLIKAVIEADTQTRKMRNDEAREEYLHILQLMSTSTYGTQVLAKCSYEVMTLCMGHVVGVCQDPVVELEGQEKNLSCALSVISVILSSSAKMSNKLIHEDYLLVRCILKILDSLFPMLHPKDADELLNQHKKHHHSSHSSHTSHTASSNILSQIPWEKITGHSPTHNLWTDAIDGTPLVNTFCTPAWLGNAGEGGDTPVAGGGSTRARRDEWRTPFTRGSVAQAESGRGRGGRWHYIPLLYENVQSLLIEIVRLAAKGPLKEEASVTESGDSEESASHMNTSNGEEKASNEEHNTDNDKEDEKKEDTSNSVEVNNDNDVQNGSSSTTHSQDDTTSDSSTKSNSPPSSVPFTSYTDTDSTAPTNSSVSDSVSTTTAVPKTTSLSENMSVLSTASVVPAETASVVPLTLQYLNSMCLRLRVQFLVKAFRQSEIATNDDILQVFQDCVLRFDLERLRHIIKSS